MESVHEPHLAVPELTAGAPEPVRHLPRQRRPDEPGAHPPVEPTDAAVIVRSLDDPEAFATLYDRHAGAIHDHVARRLGADLADELCAQTFYLAFDRRRSYDVERPDARPWLYGIVTNLIRRHRRTEVRAYRAMARADAAERAGGPAGDLDAIVSRVDATSSLRGIAAALASLSPGERDVLLLHAWEDLSHDAIATALGISPVTARTRLFRARARLRPLLRQAGSDPEDPAGPARPGRRR